MNGDQFCGTCGNPRVPKQRTCPHCGSLYGEPYTGSVGNVQDTTQSSPQHSGVMPPVPPSGNTPPHGGAPADTSAPNYFGGMPNHFGAAPFGALLAGNAPAGTPMKPTNKRTSWGRRILSGRNIVILLLLVVIGVLLVRGNIVPGGGSNHPANSSTRATATPGGIRVGKQLTCGTCSSEPVLVTIDTITINGKQTVWDITIQDNVKGVSFIINDFSLKRLGIGEVSGNVMTSTNSLSAGQMAYATATFGFAPSMGESDTLMLRIRTFYQGSTDDMPFDPFTYTF